MLLEDRTNAIISPTKHQKAVLSKTVAAATPQVAASEISKDQHLLTSRDMLVKLGLLTVQDNQAEVTPQGIEIMRNQNLLDDAGNLTPEGEKYAHGETQHPKESLIQSLNKTITE